MLSKFSHAKIQVPVSILRRRIGSFWRVLFRLLGRYKPLTAEETALTPGASVTYKGDIPPGAGKEAIQTRLHYKNPRPLFESLQNLIVTPRGAGWWNGALYERYSASRPGLRSLAPYPRPKKSVPKGIFVQSEHLDTFGDWNSEYLACLARLDEIDAPVFLPERLAMKSYVQRDAKRLGFEIIAIEEPILIEEAKVVRQRMMMRNWLPEDIAALRRFFKVNAPEPESGSMLYLSRHGEKSEIANRTHPNEILEVVVKSRGGRVKIGG